MALFKSSVILCFYSSRFFLGVAVDLMMSLLVTLLLYGCNSSLFPFSMCFALWVYYVVYFVQCFSSMSVIYLSLVRMHINNEELNRVVNTAVRR